MKKISVANLLTRFILLLLLFGTIPALAQREAKTINDGWKFIPEDCQQAERVDYDDRDWATVNIPHTWNEDAYKVRKYFKGTGWYRNHLSIPIDWVGKQIFLKLEAASKAATVYVNGKKVGDHAGGYTACSFDITEYVTAGSDNLLSIRVDNARTDIAPISADFTFFGGIYRDVWLTTVPSQHFNLTNHGSDGIFITAPITSAEKGTIAIRSEITNDAGVRSNLEINYSIYNPDGTLQQTGKNKVRIEAGKTLSVQQESKTVSHPKLWSPEEPNLYKVLMTLRDPKTGKILDSSEHYTAFRWFNFDSKEGFFLNGKPYKLRGICRHQDQKPLGIALPDELHRRDFMLMKEMGANFIRISHYPQDEAIIEMCDKLGMLAWEEIPVIDYVPDTPGYNENCETNLREMIRQHYNHPSIIVWGYMNEILLQMDRLFKTKEEQNAVCERGLALAKRLDAIVKEEDSTRNSTMAFHGTNKYNEVGLSEIPDIVGWNLYSGWYGGNLDDFDRYLAEQQTNYPDHPLIISEYGAGSDKRLHSLNPHAFDFCCEYQQTFLEHYLPVLEKTPYVCGGTHWNFIDFSSASRAESMPRINNKGLVYSDRTPKDVYYYYQSAWRNDIPVLRIASRDWNIRSGVRIADEPIIMPVKIYTNLPEVELFLDGKSLGKKSVNNYNAVFDVPFSKKTPQLLAKGYYKGEPVNDGLSLHFNPVPKYLNSQNLSGATEVAVNVGSNCFFTSAETGLTWMPDQPYEAGSWGYLEGKAKSTTAEVFLTTDGPLYQTMREGISGYRFDVPAGKYEVELLFADIYRPSKTAAYLLTNDEQKASAGNCFDIIINNQKVEHSFNPGAVNGYFNAVKKRYIVENSGESIIVNLNTLKGKTFLSGIKLRKL